MANSPYLTQKITNGHAARMRYSRFRAAILGIEPQRRNKNTTPDDKSRVTKKKKTDVVKPKKEDDETTGEAIIKAEPTTDVKPKVKVEIKQESQQNGLPAPTAPMMPIAPMVKRESVHGQPGACPDRQAPSFSNVKQEQAMNTLTNAIHGHPGMCEQPSPFDLVTSAPAAMTVAALADAHTSFIQSRMTPCGDANMMAADTSGFMMAPHSPPTASNDFVQTQNQRTTYHHNSIAAMGPAVGVAGMASGAGTMGNNAGAGPTPPPSTASSPFEFPLQDFSLGNGGSSLPASPWQSHRQPPQQNTAQAVGQQHMYPQAHGHLHPQHFQVHQLQNVTHGAHVHLTQQHTQMQHNQMQPAVQGTLTFTGLPSQTMFPPIPRTTSTYAMENANNFAAFYHQHHLTHQPQSHHNNMSVAHQPQVQQLQQPTQMEPVFPSPTPVPDDPTASTTTAFQLTSQLQGKPDRAPSQPEAPSARTTPPTTPNMDSNNNTPTTMASVSPNGSTTTAMTAPSSVSPASQHSACFSPATSPENGASSVVGGGMNGGKEGSVVRSPGPVVGERIGQAQGQGQQGQVGSSGENGGQ